MKRLGVGLIFLSISFTQATSTSCDYGSRWVSTYLTNHTLTEHDITLVANVLYWSHARSQSTLDAQVHAMPALTAVWSAWQNIAQHRLNPSTALPYNLDIESEQQILNDFWHVYQSYTHTCQAYAHTINTVINRRVPICDHAFEALEDARQQARMVVGTALLDFKQRVGDFFDYTLHKNSDAFACYDNDIMRMAIRSSVIDYLWSYFPTLAINSFVKANKINNQVSTESWKTLATIQEVGIYTWNVIETARALYYKDMYNAFMAHVLQQTPDKKVPLVFDHTGYLKQGDTQHYAPFSL